MYRVIIGLCCILNLLPINAAEKKSKPTLPLNNPKEITWLIQDTFEWDNYKKNISTSTSHDTAVIVMTNLINMGYKLNYVKATGKRANRFLKEHTNVCTSNKIKTKAREEFSLYSLPHDIYLGLKLYRRSQLHSLTQEVFNSKGEVISLKRLFKFYPEQVLAVSRDSSYGSNIDNQIKKMPHNNIFKLTRNSRLDSLAEVFLKGRIDYIIYYPTDMDKITNGEILLESYKLANTPPYILGYVTCSKSPEGKDIINDVNKALKQAYLNPAFYHAHEKWLPTSDLPIFREYYLEVFGQFPEY